MIYKMEKEQIIIKMEKFNLKDIMSMTKKKEMESLFLKMGIII
jgi:hypothetical protein